MAEEIDPSVKFESFVAGLPYLIPNGEKNPIIQKLSSLLDYAPIGYCPGYTEADLYHRLYHIQTIILGPGDINNAHKTHEFVSIDQLHLAVKYYQRIIDEFMEINE